MSETESGSAAETSAKPATSNSAGTRIVRSRFPKAQPNVALSSGLARIRRLSGHYGSTGEQSGVDQQQQVTPAVPSTPPPAQAGIGAMVAAAASPLHHHTHHHLVESVLLSPRVQQQQEAASVTPLGSPAPPTTHSLVASLIHHDARSPFGRQVSTFRQFVISGGSGAPSPAAPSSSSTAAALAHYLQPATPGSAPPSNSYKPRFSKEHIMNIIKFKAMQKLKKNESEVLFSLL